MNLTEAKDQIARKYCYKEWNEIDWYALNYSFHEDLPEGVCMESELEREWAILYASEKVKEALKVAAERAEVIYHDGTTKQETHHKQVNVGNNHVRPNRGMILSLETELVNNIKNEK